MEQQTRLWPRPFTSALSRREGIMVIAYLPIHLLVLQLGFSLLAEKTGLPLSTADLLYYLTGFVYMVAAAFGFLRRDFDALIDAPFSCLREIARGYLAMLCCNFLLGLLFLLLPESENPNNAAVLEAAQTDMRSVKAAVIFLAPVVEEMMFRAGIFGLIRRRNRRAAYIVSVLCFALYHVVPYALFDPLYWLFLLQYIPVSVLLANCYERTNSIWCSIFFHMLVNGISFSAISALG
ncbi:MAG: CPBP family intramembrane metalloprotease [Oscillospiraceae bacterium]|nr:CPBP family intramembrane metalloprotease [Oscillospiraceae bacterium]